MQNIIIRNAIIKDCDKIAEIKIEGWQTAYRGIIDDNFLDSMDKEQEIKKRRTNIENGVNIIVAEFNNDIVGFCIYRNYNKDLKKYLNANCEISSLYVKSTLKRKGIGTKILSDIIEKYKDYNIVIQYFKNNPVGNLYKKLGFNIYDETEFYYKMKRTRGGN